MSTPQDWSRVSSRSPRSGTCSATRRSSRPSATTISDWRHFRPPGRRPSYQSRVSSASASASGLKLTRRLTLDPAASCGLHPRGLRTQGAERAPSSADPAPQPHSAVENPQSEFCQRQCDNWSAAPGSTCANRQGTGYVGCARLASTIVRHEAHPTQNSPYSPYVLANNNPSNNIKTGAEPLVGSVGVTPVQFTTTVNNTLFFRRIAIENATSPHPCDVCTSDCTQFLGKMNCKNPFTNQWEASCSGE